MTSLVTLQADVCTVSSDLKTASYTFAFDPSTNISGRRCIVKATDGYFLYAKDPVGTYFVDVLGYRVDWTQPFSQRYTSASSSPDHIPTLAWTRDVNSFTSGETICTIPDGPHQLTVSVYQMSNQIITSSQYSYLTAIAKLNASTTITTSTNDTLTYTVDGSPTTSVTITAGSYTPAQMVTQLQSKLGSNFVVGIVADVLYFQHKTSAFKFESTSNSLATLGFTASTSYSSKDNKLMLNLQITPIN
jgi:hypothetical protein